MTQPLRIGLVGDFDATVPAHMAIPRALAMAGTVANMTVLHEWVSTEEITTVSRVLRFDGLWCVPASPYRSMEGALRAIRFAREQRRPFLGTCGGFQHAILEHARNVLHWTDAEHAEIAPDAARLVITPLDCALVEASGEIYFKPGTRLAAAYGMASAREDYRCRYGLNRAFRAALAAGPLLVSAEDEAGDVRAVERAYHPFFVATLFQPERAALAGRLPPVVLAFIIAMLAQRA